MYSVGVDLHKDTSWFYILDPYGNKFLSQRIMNHLTTLDTFFSKIPQPFQLAVEATYNWYYFVDLARNYSKQVYLANSYELKAFAKRHKKNDKIDSRLIADLLKKGYLPTVTIADKETRQIRELLRYRLMMVKDRSRNIFRLKALLDKLGINSNGNFCTYKRLKQIDLNQIQGTYRYIASKYIDQISYLIEKTSDIEKQIKLSVHEDEDIQNLLTLPGLDYFSAALVKSEIIDINRFKTFNRLCAYSGLAPRTKHSGNKEIFGPLNKNRCKNLQWILIENVYHYIKCIPKKKERYQKLKIRKGANTAKVILARDMLKLIYQILKNKESFDYSKTNKIQSGE